MEQIYDDARQIPPNEVAELIAKLVIELAPTSDAKSHHKMSMHRSDPRGIWKDVPDITDEEIAEMRREMWSGFPNEDFE